MDDLTTERLRTRLRSAQIATAAEISLPPVALIRTRLTRRRRNRAAATVMAAVALAAAIAVPGAIRHGGQGTNTPAVIPTSASPSPTASVSALPTTSSIPGVPGSGHPATVHSSGPACVGKEYLQVGSLYGNGSRAAGVTFKANVDSTYHLCPGEKIHVFWVQYEFQPDGSQTVFTIYRTTLSSSHPSETYMFPDVSSVTCLGNNYVVDGSFAVVPRIPPLTWRPYPVWKAYKGGELLFQFLQPCPGMPGGPDLPTDSPSPTSS